MTFVHKDEYLQVIGRPEKVYIPDLNDITIDNLHIHNITSYMSTYQKHIKVNTFHYYIEDQLEDDDALNKFDADQIVITAVTPKMLHSFVEKLKNVKEIIVYGYESDFEPYPSNVSTIIYTGEIENDSHYIMGVDHVIFDTGSYNKDTSFALHGAAKEVTVVNNCGIQLSIDLRKMLGGSTTVTLSEYVSY